MDPYTFGLTLGSVGLGVMALSGLAQATRSGRAHAHGHSGHGSAGGIAHGHVTTRMLAPLSPRVAFSAFIGCSASGLVLHPLLGEPALLLTALGDGIAFDLLDAAPPRCFR